MGIGLLTWKPCCGALLVYAAHGLLAVVSTTYAGSWIRDYIGDFLALLVIIPLSITLQNHLGLRSQRARICLVEVAAYVALFAVFFEMVAPRLWDHSTGDLLDVAFYAAGGVCLWAMEGKGIWNRQCFPYLRAQPPN